MVRVRYKLTALASALRRAPRRTLSAFRPGGGFGRRRAKVRCQTRATMAESSPVIDENPDMDDMTPTEQEYTTISRGRGFPMVVLHGLMGGEHNWRNAMRHLPKTCRRTALRLPFFENGHRLNTIPLIKDYVRGYLDHVGHPRLLLGGNSLGGHVSLHLAMDMPDRIAGLVLTGSSGLYEREMGRPQGANPSREWVYEKMCEIFFDPVNVTDEMVDGVLKVLSGRQYKRDLVSIAKSAKRDNLASRLPQVTCPVLLIWGRQDSVTPPEVADEFLSLLPKGKLEWIDDCGHAPMIERPKEFGKIVSKWWRRVGAAEQRLAEGAGH